MPIPTPVKFAIAAGACAYCWKVGDKEKAASIAEKIAAVIMCGACAGVAGNEMVKHGVGLYKQVKQVGPPAPANQAPAPQPKKIKTPPKTSPAQNAIAGRRAGYVDVGVITTSSAIVVEGPRRSYSSMKRMKQAEIQQAQDEEFINAEYENYI